MEVILMNYTPLEVCEKAIRTCWDSHDKSDKKNECGQIGCIRYKNRTKDPACIGCEISDIQLGDKDHNLIERVGNKFKHGSTLEHIVFTFYIKGVSRALLQELARHRIASLSVKSTRYTLKRLKDENFNVRFLPVFEYSDNFKDYLVFTGFEMADRYNINMLIALKKILKSGVPVDYAKYCLPEAFKTEFTWTINLRSLQNFLSLRSDKSALWEIRELSKKVFDAIPEEYKYLLEEFVKNK